MAKITFNVGEGGLGRPLAGKDYYSAFLFDSSILPSGFSVDDPIKFIGSLKDAENLGIVNDGTGETVASGGTVEVTAVGAAGDIITVSLQSIHGEKFELCSIVEGSSETVETLATRIAAAITARKSEHGFTASAALGVVSLVMAPNWGAAFNTGNLTCVTTGAATFTITQFSGGVGSDLSVIHYHISEFFRLQPKGFLWVAINDYSGGFEPDDIISIVNYADGDIRQLGVYLKTAFATTDMAAIQTAITELQQDYKPLNAIYAADQLGDAIAALTDLRALTYNRVSACIGQDGGAEGWRLMDVMGRSISCIGSCLGAVALAAVHENIGWVAKYNLASTELDKVSFTTGDLLSGVSSATQELLINRGYVFVRKYVGKAGSYFSDSPTATEVTSDYAYIENGRTIDKAIRGVYAALADYLNSPLYVDPTTGHLSELTISNWKNTASLPLEQMLIDGELSGYGVIINPEQNVLQTSEVEVTIKLVPVGVAREIIVNIGYTVSLAA